ncbi:MAG: hypothetical protein ABW171_12025 [Steroidobacter sp.]
MNARGGRSGAIVNLTLMEVFVIIAFMFIIYASLTSEEAKRMIGRLEAQIAELMRERATLQEEIKRQAERIEALTKPKVSDFPPLCEPYKEGGAPYGVIELLPGGNMRVFVPKRFSVLEFEGKTTMDAAEFRRNFARLRQLTVEAKCRLAVKIVTSTSDLREYKRSLALVRGVFYTSGELKL